MKKKKETNENYLDRIPVRREGMEWSTGDDGLVTLHVENKGVLNTVAQKLFKKPRITYVHLDENGSFIWPLIDGEKDITAIGVYVKAHFGEAAEPLYPRLAKFIQILSSYGFVTFK